MVAGGISTYVRTDLHVVPQAKSVDGQHYHDEILPLFEKALKDKDMFPRHSLAVLMQDRATAHTAIPTIRQIEESISHV